MEIADEARLGHSTRDDRKEAGATYTPPQLAAATARTLLAGFAPDPEVRLRVLDPGCGDGALTEALLGALPAAMHAKTSITCLDCDAGALAQAKARLTRLFPDASITFMRADFLDFAAQSEMAGQGFDLIIANPPYVRIQTLDKNTRSRIKAEYGLTGRTDLAFAFLIAFTRLLSPGGRAAVITSNRVLSTQAGAPVRTALLAQSRVTQVWDLGDSRLFDAAVLPAVLFFENPEDGRIGAEDASFTSLYEAQAEVGMTGTQTQDLCADLTRNLVKITPSGQVFTQARGRLLTDGTWRLGSEKSLDWAARVAAHTWKSFGDVGRVSVGIKTTADSIFIARDWPTPRPELLRPLVTHHVAGRYRPSTPAMHEVLYPHEMREGKRAPVDLATHPHAQAYLEQHRARLAGRDYVRDAGREWFEIWVPHLPSDWETTKIVFRDIAERPTFWIESAGAVVNGDCYWVRLEEGVDPDLIWLMLAVGNSALIETFYDVTFNERLYAGRRRFMTRHVKRFPIPDPKHPAAQRAATAARRLFEEDMDAEARATLERQVDRDIEIAFGFA